MHITVVIPTRGDKKNVNHSISCFQKQTYRDFEVIFVVDKKITNSNEYQKIDNIKFINNQNSKFRPGKGASYVRNFGIQNASSGYIMLMDDDEDFPEDFLSQMVVARDHYYKIIGKDFVLTPTLMYRHTGKIQNQGFGYFNYRLSRPIVKSLGNKYFDYIQMYSANCLFAPAYIFKKILFDEKIDFVYEDLDFSYRIHKAGYPMIVVSNPKIYHMERDKTRLEDARIGTTDQAYKKAKHRIVFVKKNANTWQKTQFFLLGLWGQPIWLVAKILMYAPINQKIPLLKALWKGTIDGLKAKM